MENRGLDLEGKMLHLEGVIASVECKLKEMNKRYEQTRRNLELCRRASWRRMEGRRYQLKCLLTGMGAAHDLLLSCTFQLRKLNEEKERGSSYAI